MSLSSGISLRPFYFSREEFSSVLPTLYKPLLKYPETGTGKGNEPKPLPCLACARLLGLLILSRA